MQTQDETSCNPNVIWHNHAWILDLQQDIVNPATPTVRIRSHADLNADSFFKKKSQSCSNIWVGNQSKKKRSDLKSSPISARPTSSVARYWGCSLTVWLISETHQSRLQTLKVARGTRFIHTVCILGKMLQRHAFFFFLEVGVDVREAEQRDGRKCARPLPSTQIPPGVPSSGKPLTGSSQAFTFSKEPAAPGKSGVVTGGDGETSGRGLRRKWRTKGKGRQTLFKLLSPN